MATNYKTEGKNVTWTNGTGSAVSSGDIVLVGNVVGVATVDIADGSSGVVAIAGVWSLSKTSGLAISQGDILYYDASADEINKSPAGNAFAGFAHAAATAGATTVDVLLMQLGEEDLEPAAPELDAATDTADFELLPARANPSGLLIVGVFGIVTEVFAGATEDQGIVTVYDEDNNAIATLTPSDAGADAVGDVIVGYSLYAASTGAAGKSVAAGKYVDCKVTQATSGAGAAGKMRVHLITKPLT